MKALSKHISIAQRVVGAWGDQSLEWCMQQPTGSRDRAFLALVLETLGLQDERRGITRLYEQFGRNERNATRDYEQGLIYYKNDSWFRWRYGQVVSSFNTNPNP